MEVATLLRTSNPPHLLLFSPLHSISPVAQGIDLHRDAESGKQWMLAKAGKPGLQRPASPAAPSWVQTPVPFALQLQVGGIPKHPFRPLFLFFNPGLGSQMPTPIPRPGIQSQQDEHTTRPGASPIDTRIRRGTATYPKPELSVEPSELTGIVAEEPFTANTPKCLIKVVPCCSEFESGRSSAERKEIRQFLTSVFVSSQQRLTLPSTGVGYPWDRSSPLYSLWTLFRLSARSHSTLTLVNPLTSLAGMHF
jgi:hypothetical protein